MTNAIETRGLVKTFGETRALDGLELTVREGSVYGLPGPNGAGKTTTIRILTTLLAPDEGCDCTIGSDSSCAARVRWIFADDIILRERSWTTTTSL